MNYFFVLFIVSLEIATIICTPNCEDFTTCSTCILSTFDDCVWCSSDSHEEKRCQSKKLVNSTWCQKTMVRPEIRTVTVKNDDWSSGENGTKIVQFKPQKVDIKLASPGRPVNISMYYKPAKDAPLDIYFVVDNSRSIEKAKRELIKKIDSILKGIESYTNNVLLGIGTFVEKPLLPYANRDYQNVYSFRNDLSLTPDTKKFVNILKEIKVGLNFDYPENTLGALMDAMLCEPQVRWRNDSRRIIFVFTNDFYHSAGDGKFVGSFERHDMNCHMDTDKDITMDYPSIPQINKVAKDNNYIIIFGSSAWNKPKLLEQYKLLAEQVHGARVAQGNLANIDILIKDEYLKVIGKLDLTAESPPNIKVEITETCSDCKAMHYSDPLEYVATVKVISCPDPPKDNEIIKIRPNLFNEELEVMIQYGCQCECEKDNSVERDSQKCNKYGDYQCGICKCKPDRSGDTCMCEIDSVDFVNNTKKCKNSTEDAFRCNGHGECSCGKCVCDQGFSGLFCEYNDNECPRSNGKLCSGHGTCNMGKCQCDREWVHSPDGIEDCGCTTQQKSCKAPHSDKVCSGNGECKCGQCICSTKDNSNDTCSGRYCDRCTWSEANRCEELQDYAYCRFLNETSCEDQYNMTDTIVYFANRTDINSPDNVEWYMAKWCRITKGDDESIFVFKYYYSSANTDIEDGDEGSKLTLVIQKELDEKPPANIWIAVGSAIGGILLIGLLTLLLWKVLTDLYDAREYNQFLAKAKAEGYDVNMTENPWYEPPTSFFYNPAHVPGTSGNQKD